MDTRSCRHTHTFFPPPLAVILSSKLQETYRVLVINLAITLADWDQLSILAAIVGGVEAGLSTWLEDDAASDGAEEVAVLRVAGVLCIC